MKYQIKLDGNKNLKTYSDAEYNLLKTAKESQYKQVMFAISKSELRNLKEFLGIKNDVKPEIYFQSILNLIKKKKINITL